MEYFYVIALRAQVPLCGGVEFTCIGDYNLIDVPEGETEQQTFLRIRDKVCTAAGLPTENLLVEEYSIRPNWRVA